MTICTKQTIELAILALVVHKPRGDCEAKLVCFRGNGKRKKQRNRCRKSVRIADNFKSRQRARGSG
jgi:hypothetical protein